MEDFTAVVAWLVQVTKQLWTFLGTAGFLGFAVIGLFVLKRIALLFKKIIL